MRVQVFRSAQEKVPLWHDKTLEEIPFFNAEVIRYRSYIAVKDGPVLCGLASFVEDSMRVPGAIGISFVSTHPAHRNKGVAGKMVRALFELARAEKKPLANTAYEPDGEKWLKHVFHRTAIEFPDVQFFER